MKTLIISLLVFAVVETQGGIPIEVVYGYGRNGPALKLWDEAEKELKTGDYDNAYRNVEAALQTDPTLYPALYTRAKIYLHQGKYQLAIQDCSEALKRDSTFVEAALLRADANEGLGRYDASLKELNHVVSIRPRIDGLARAFSDRAWLRATCPLPAYRNAQQAIKDATTACKLMQWKDEGTIDTLAAAYAEAGDFDSAVRYEEKALDLKDITPADLKLLQHHLELFKHHQPVRSKG